MANCPYVLESQAKQHRYGLTEQLHDNNKSNFIQDGDSHDDYNQWNNYCDGQLQWQEIDFSQDRPPKYNRDSHSNSWQRNSNGYPGQDQTDDFIDSRQWFPRNNDHRSQHVRHRQLDQVNMMEDGVDSSIRYIDVLVNGLLSNGFIDSGAGPSIISQRYVKGKIRYSPCLLDGLGGTFPAIGMTRETLTVGGEIFTDDFYVVEDSIILPYDLYIGRNILD